MSIKSVQSNSLCSSSKPRCCASFDLRRRREEEPGVINHPRQEGVGGAEREFDLAKVDGGAGVRKSRENMGERNRDGRCGVGRMSGAEKGGM